MFGFVKKVLANCVFQLFNTPFLLSFIRLLAVMPEGKSTLVLLHFHHSFSSSTIPDPGFFFLLRSWHSFNSILDIYRTGLLHLNNDMCALVLQVSTLEKCKKHRIHHLDLIQLWLSTLDTEGLSGLPPTNKFA